MSPFPNNGFEDRDGRDLSLEGSRVFRNSPDEEQKLLVRSPGLGIPTKIRIITLRDICAIIISLVLVSLLLAANSLHRFRLGKGLQIGCVHNEY